MDRPVRIAVVGSADERLIGDLRQLPLGPEVRPLSSVVADTEALMRFQPDVLLARLHDDPSEDIGAVKLLQRLWPAMVVGVLADQTSITTALVVNAAFVAGTSIWFWIAASEQRPVATPVAALPSGGS